MEKQYFNSAASVEAAFYAAFADCSVRNMDAVWGQHEVVCIHPGAAALIGRDAVMKSWARILVSAAMPDLQYEIVNQVENSKLAVHLVREIISPADGQPPVIVQATNVYAFDDDGWKLITHHGSPALVQQRKPREEPAIKHTLQ